MSKFLRHLFSTQSTNDSEETSKAILARCSENGGRPNQHELHKVVGSENDDTEVLIFPCKLSFDMEYSFLISHDEKFRVVAIDGEQLICCVLLFILVATF